MDWKTSKCNCPALFKNYICPAVNIVSINEKREGG